MVALIARKLQIDDSVVRSTVDFMWDQGLRYDNEEDVIRTVRGGHPQPSTASEADAIHTRDGSSEPEIDLYDVICAACSWLNTPEQQQAHLLQFVQSHGPEKLFYWILSNRLQWKSRPEIREALRHLLCSCFSQFQDVVDSFGSLVDQLVSLPSDEETTAKELGQVFRCSFERCRAIFLNTSSHPAASNGVTGAFGRREQALSRIQNAQYLANEKNHWAALIGDFKAAVENAFKHPIEDQTNHPASGVVQGRKEKIWEPKSTHEERREIESKLSQLRMVQAQLSAQLTACERDISQLMEKLREIDLQCGGLAERRPVQQHSVELVEVMRSIDSFVFTMDKSCCHHGPALWSTTFLGDYLEAEEECVKLVVDRIRLNQAKQNEIEKELAVYRSLALTRLTRDYENRREVLAKERSADMLALEQVMQTLSGMTGNSNLINDSLAGEWALDAYGAAAMAY